MLPGWILRPFDKPVSSKERMYPQHLIKVAIDLLQAADINWEYTDSVTTPKTEKRFIANIKTFAIILVHKITVFFLW
jgi:hypothetical protein